MNNYAEWLTAFGTIAVAAVAAFQDRIRHWVTSPELELSARVAPPDCHKTSWMLKRLIDLRSENPTVNIVGPTYYPTVDALPCYYFRLSVTNSGKDEARRVEVFARRLQRRRADGSFEEVNRFTPMNLLWAHIRKPFLESLSPGIPKVCDLAHVIHPKRRKDIAHTLDGVPDDKAILAFDLEVEPAMKGHLIAPGTYRLSLILAAANAPRREYTLEINFPGEWYDDETQMLRDGFGMRLVD